MTTCKIFVPAASYCEATGKVSVNSDIDYPMSYHYATAVKAIKRCTTFISAVNASAANGVDVSEDYNFYAFYMAQLYLLLWQALDGGVKPNNFSEASNLHFAVGYAFKALAEPDRHEALNHLRAIRDGVELQVVGKNFYNCG